MGSDSIDLDIYSRLPVAGAVPRALAHDRGRAEAGSMNPTGWKTKNRGNLNPVVVNGTIALQGSDKNLLLMLKVGLKDITLDTPFERPAFAYLQTPSASAAKAEQHSADGEGGYKLFVYSGTDEEILRLLQEMMDAAKVTIGYNRKKGGLDVLVPLD